MTPSEVSKIKPGAYVAEFEDGTVTECTVGYSTMDDPESPRWFAAPYFVNSTTEQRYWNKILRLTPAVEFYAGELLRRTNAERVRTVFVDLDEDHERKEPLLNWRARERDLGEIGLHDFRSPHVPQLADRVIVAKGPRMRILKNRASTVQRGWLVTMVDEPAASN